MQTPSDTMLHAASGEQSAKSPRSVFSNFQPELSAENAAQELPSASRVFPDVNGQTLQAQIDCAMARSFLCRFLAQACADPEPESWAWLTAPAIHQAVLSSVQSLPAQGSVLPAAAAALVSSMASNSIENVQDDYVSAFGHAARGNCPMNEIEYGDIKADPLFQPHRLADLGAFYRAFGMELGDNAGERHDHICIELEFMSVLAAKEAYALEHQLDQEQLALVRDAQKQFLREHLGRWVPAFTRRLERASGGSFLTALARMLREFVVGDCARFGLRPGSEDLLLRPVDEAAESMCASCGITNLPPGAAAPKATT
jgi:putative dimethyl sulfoxide reductase chaperone